MNKVKAMARKFWNDESGQGMAEYVLLIVVVVGVATIFKKPIMDMVSGKLSSISEEFGQFSSKAE